MKHPAGYAAPRRSAAAPRRKTRLDLRPRARPQPDDDLSTAEPPSHFGRWVLLVALLHALAIGIIWFLFEHAPAPPPPEQFMSLLPPGDTVKGAPGAQQAHKLGATTAAPTEHHHSKTEVTKPIEKPTPAAAQTPPPPKPAVAQVKPITPPPVLRPDAALIPDKPVPAKPAPVKPTPPKPTVKLSKDDLKLVDDSATDKPVTKPKHHPKKPAPEPDSTDAPESDTTSNPNSTGLSKEQIAAQLGEKLDAAGVKSATHTGTSGSAASKQNGFHDFYAAIRDQVMSEWQSPNLADQTAVSPIVQIHVEPDGRVPSDSVVLIQSSGNTVFDESAVAAAKNLGYLHEPLPEGCSPDIPITFNLTR